MLVDHERPGMFAPPNNQRPWIIRHQEVQGDSSDPQFSTSSHSNQQQRVQRYQKQQQEWTMRLLQRVGYEHQDKQPYPFTNLSVSSKNKQLPCVQRTNSQQFETAKKARRSSQIVNGVIYTGSFALENARVKLEHAKELLASDCANSYFIGYGPSFSGSSATSNRDDTQRIMTANDLCSAQPLWPLSSRQLKVPQWPENPRRSGPLPLRPYNTDKHILELASVCETTASRKGVLRITNPDSVTPTEVLTCQMARRFGRPEHQEMFFSSDYPYVPLQTESRPVLDSFLNTAETIPVGGIGKILTSDCEEKDREEEEEEKEEVDGSEVPEGTVVRCKPAPLDPDTGKQAISSNTTILPNGAVNQIQTDYLVAAHEQVQPVSKWSDYYQAKGTWRFPHEEVEAIDALHSPKTVIESGSSRSGSPFAPALTVHEAGNRMARESMLEAVLCVCVANNLEKDVPTATAILQYGVGSQMARGNREDVRENQ